MRIVMGIDTETTGLDQSLGHKIIEIAMLEYDLDTGAPVSEWVQRFDPQRSIDPKAQAVHGIAYSDLVGMPTWEDKAEEINYRLSKVDLLVAHNMMFDGPFIGMELARVGQVIPTLETVCTMEEGRWACYDGKRPNLGELCFALGVPYDKSKAHGASYDTQVTMECFFRGLKRGFYKLPNCLLETSSEV